ncbi:MAG: hypothetical protein GF364_13905 [Candidatus Lokiarchaeota archaeon]|nr:hypothetical protein [Candidatus Lokiarchaeota archaeon]
MRDNRFIRVGNEDRRRMVQLGLLPINRLQSDYIKTGLDHISSDLWNIFQREPYNLYYTRNKTEDIFLVHHERVSVIKHINPKGKIEHTGIYFGFIRNNEFYLGLEGAEFIYFDLKLNKEKNFQLKKIVVNRAAEKSFLYGNTLHHSDFVNSPQQLNRKDVIFVLNTRNQLIGIGYIYKPYKSVPGAKLELRNLVDYGYYIRRGY